MFVIEGDGRDMFTDDSGAPIVGRVACLEEEYRVERLKRLKSISIYAQAEWNDRKGIVLNALQKEFAQRFVYGRCCLKESWAEYLTRHKEKRLRA